MTVLGTYNVTRTPAIVVLPYGEGRVFLIGPHAEVEEDSDRDGQDIESELSDEGSDWPLLLEAMKWITQTPNSYTTTFQATNLVLDSFLIFTLTLYVQTKKQEKKKKN